MIRFSVSAAIALIASLAFAATEIPVSSIVYTGAVSMQDQPQAATDGTNFLIAWRDYREYRGYPTIYAKLVGGDGQLLGGPTALSIPDPHDRPVNGSSNAAPAVAWTGSVYLVFWDDASTRSARYVRIDRDGNLLDTAPQVIPGVTMLRAGAAASASRGAMFVYADVSEHPSVHGVVFGTGGDVIARDIALPHGFVDDFPVVASNGDFFLVSWRRWEGGTTGDFVVAAKVALDGTVSEAQVLDTSLGWPAIASNGDDFAVLYVHRSKALVAAHVDRDGKLLSRTGLPATFGWPFPDNPIGRYGNGYVVAIHGTDSAVKGIVLDRDAKPVSEVALSTLGVAHYVIAFAANSHETIAVWPEMRAGVTVDRDIFARVLGTDTETLVSRSAARQSDPHIASNGNGYLAVWIEYRADGGGEVRANRISVDGRPAGGEGIKLGGYAYRSPQIVFDGRNYVVAWFNNQQRAIMISRIAPDGVLLDPPGGRVAAAADYSEFGLGTNGRESLLVWTTDLENRWLYRAATIGEDGIVGAPFVDIPYKEHGVEEISVAGTADTWLVAWSEAWSPPWPFGPPPPVLHNVIAERISRGSLLALDADPLPIATSGAEERHSSVATNGTDFLVAWDQEGTVLARTVTSSGLLGDPVTVGRGGNVSAAWSGNHYDVAWEDGGDLFTARFTEQPLPIALANTADAESHVAITATPAHGLFVLYERVASEAMYGYVSRVFARSVPPPTRLRSVRR